MASKPISAADALKIFAPRGIKVQTATPAEKKGEDGVVRKVFETALERLAAAHILSAVKREDGSHAIVTIDGRRHEVGGAAE